MVCYYHITSHKAEGRVMSQLNRENYAYDRMRTIIFMLCTLFHSVTRQHVRNYARTWTTQPHRGRHALRDNTICNVLFVCAQHSGARFRACASCALHINPITIMTYGAPDATMRQHEPLFLAKITIT